MEIEMHAVDEYAVVKAQIEALTKREKELKAAILAEGKFEVEGDKFAAKISLFEQARLDTAIAKSFLTAAQIAEATKTIEVTKITVKAKKGEVLAA
jgi:adenine/guanine phosphoribosyltransferase-like PRPP-binding protein